MTDATSTTESVEAQPHVEPGYYWVQSVTRDWGLSTANSVDAASEPPTLRRSRPFIVEVHRREVTDGHGEKTDVLMWRTIGANHERLWPGTLQVVERIKVPETA